MHPLARGRAGSPAARGAAVLALCLASAWVLAAPAELAGPQPLALGPPRDVAPGVTLFHVTETSLVNPPGPLSVWLLRIDPRRADVRPALANDEVVDREPVAATAARHGAHAAVNAGFFFPNGDPQGLYKFNGQLISDTTRRRGAVGFIRGSGATRLIFDRVTAGASVVIERGSRAPVRVPIAGVDTTRLLGRLMLFTPAYDEHTGTADGGQEWAIDGSPLRVVDGPRPEGRTPIPRSGFVLSFGGRTPPPGLRRVRKGTRLRIDVRYGPVSSRTEDWEAAADIVGGAGLLAREGHYLDDWTPESFNAGFAENRHPRTMIGTTADGTIWLAAIDGRQPHLSVGMTLIEVRELARRLGLVNALNLDGGGSTTMWVSGRIVNSPSDAAGPRPVSDALLVVARPH